MGLTTTTVHPKSLSDDEREALIDELYAVQQEVFDGVTRYSFAKYVVNSPAEQSWIDVTRDDEGKAVAYIALHRFDRELDGKPCVIFRAEAGTLRPYRGKTPVAGIFIAHCLPHAMAHPFTATYYLGSLVHPSSYHAFARYIDDIWPNGNREVPESLLAFMCRLGDEFGLEMVDPARPLVREVGWITRDSEMERAYWRTCEKPTVAWFLKANPGYPEGHGLLTLVSMDARSLSRAVGGFLKGRLSLRLAAAHVLLQRLPGFRPKVTVRDVRALLKAEEFLRELGSIILDKLQTTTRIMIQPRGRYLFRAGDRGDEMYLVLEGAAYVVIGEGKDEMVVDQIGHGQAFGEMAMLTGHPRSASVRTATACKLLVIGREALDSVFAESPETEAHLWHLFDRRSFDVHLRTLPRYADLERPDRMAWFEEGQPIKAQGEVPVEGPAVLFLARGRADILSENARVTTAAPALIEVSGSTVMEPEEGAHLYHLPADRPEAAAASS